MKSKYKKDEEGPSETVTIQGNEISLIFKPHLGAPEGNWEKDGWELKLLKNPPKVRSILSPNVPFYWKKNL